MSGSCRKPKEGSDARTIIFFASPPPVIQNGKNNWRGFQILTTLKESNEHIMNKKWRANPPFNCQNLICADNIMFLPGETIPELYGRYLTSVIFSRPAERDILLSIS